MIRNYFKIAWRNITRHKVYSAINIFGLSLGICSCIVIFLIAHFELSFDKFHPDGDRIYRIVGEIQNPSGEQFFLNNMIRDVAGVRDQIPGFEATAAFHSYDGKITIPEGSKQPKKFDNKIEGTFSSTAILTWPSYFSIFQYEWLAGNPGVLSEPFRVVLTLGRARKYFGDLPPEQMIGKTVVYDDSLRVTVAGIVKDWTARSDFNYTDFISVSTATHSFLRANIPTEDWASLRPHNGSAFVKLSKTVTPGQINEKLTAFVKSHIRPGTGKLTLYLQPLSAIHFTNEFRRGDDGDDFIKGYMPLLYILMGIALFILIIAAVNFINLSTAQSIQRMKEVGVRKVMGSSKKSITIQFLSETFVLTILATFLSVLLVNPVLYLFHDFIRPEIEFHPFEPAVLVFILLLSLLTTLLAGYYPARVLSSYLPALSLKGTGFQEGRGRLNFRKALIVFQFTISLVFIILVLTMGRQIRYMTNGDKGFNPDAIITINKWRDNGRLALLATQVKKIPGVSKTLLQFNSPMGFAQVSSNFKYKGKEEMIIQPTMEFANEDYIPFYQMKLIAGRNMNHSDSANELVINETLARAIGCTDPKEAVGKMLYDAGQGSNKSYPIVGVVADFHQGSFHDAILPAVIQNAPDNNKRSVAIKLAGGEKDVKEVKAVLSQIELQWKKLYPEEPFNYSFLNQSITWLYGQEEKTAWLANAASLVTIFISAMGLFGLSLFAARRRTREIGIRKVLGATASGIATMLGRDFLKLVAISFLIAAPIGYYLSNKWLEDFAYKTTITAGIFIIAGLSAILVTIITISFQALKAAYANPVDILRNE